MSVHDGISQEGPLDTVNVVLTSFQDEGHLRIKKRVEDLNKVLAEKTSKPHRKRGNKKPNLMTKSIFARLQKGTKTPEQHAERRAGSDLLMPVINGSHCLVSSEVRGNESREKVKQGGHVDEVDGQIRLPCLTASDDSGKKTSRTNSDGAIVNYDKDQYAVLERSDTIWESDSHRMEHALEAARKALERQRDDNESGVPKEFSFLEPECKVVYEGSAVEYKRRKRAKAAAAAAKRDAETSDGEQISDRMSRSLKQRSFFSSKSSNNGSMGTAGHFMLPAVICSGVQNTAGVDWKVVQETNGQNCTGPKRLERCKTMYPVTDEMHRQGTSVSMTRGRALNAGEWNVAKVWQRRHIESDMIPVQMANEDIT